MSESFRYWLTTVLGVLLRDALKWLAGSLAAWGVVFAPEDQDRATKLLAAAGVALVAYGWSLLARWRDKQSLPLPNENAFRPGPSGRLGPMVLLGVSLAALVAGAGCSSVDTPAKRYGAALLAYDAANRSFTVMAEAGAFSDRQIVATKPLWVAADEQVRILKESWRRGEGVNQTALIALDGVLDAIERWLAVRIRKQ